MTVDRTVSPPLHALNGALLQPVCLSGHIAGHGHRLSNLITPAAESHASTCHTMTSCKSALVAVHLNHTVQLQLSAILLKGLSETAVVADVDKHGLHC